MKSSLKYILTTDELEKLTGLSDIIRFLEKKELPNLRGSKTLIPPELVKVYLADKGIDYSFKVLAHINMKGGVGKTTSTISAATRAVQYGFKTCILDMDSQASTSLALAQTPAEDEPIFYDVWEHPDEMVMGSLKAVQENLFILPSSLENSLLDLKLVRPDAQKNAVRNVCEVLKANGFDLVVIDAPPSLGTAVISTICALDIITIPICSDIFSFKGLKLTLNEITSICETFNLKYPEIKILYTRFDKRIKISIDAFHRLSAEYAQYLIPVPIRISSEFSKSLERHETIFASAKKSTAKEDYDAYVRQILGLNKTFTKKGIKNAG